MADELTQADKEEIMAWLKEKWVTPKTCPICTHNNWIIGANIVVPMRFLGGGINLGGNVYPQFMIICGNCGHTHYFNAAIARLKSLEKKEGGDTGTS